MTRAGVHFTMLLDTTAQTYWVQLWMWKKVCSEAFIALYGVSPISKLKVCIYARDDDMLGVCNPYPVSYPHTILYNINLSQTFTNTF